MKQRVSKANNFINNKFDFILFTVVIVLLATGIVMVLSASAPTSLAENGKSYTYAVRQLGFAVLGVTAMIIISKIDYHIYKKFYWPAYIVSVVILLFSTCSRIRFWGKWCYKMDKMANTVSTIRSYKSFTNYILCRLFGRS